MIKLAIFDWNGTLLADTAPVVEGANKELEVYGHPGITLRQYRDNYDVPIIDFLVKIGVSEETVKEKGKIAAQAFYDYYEPRVSKAHTRKGARQVLEELGRHHVSRVILSNHTTLGIQSQLSRLGLDHQFETILANDVMGSNLFVGKQENLKQYLNKNQINPTDAVIIGDTVEEVRIARNLNIKVVCIAGGHNSTNRLKAAKPDFLIKNFDELASVLGIE